VTAETAAVVSRQTRLVQRDSKLSGPLFALALVTGILHQPAGRLNFLAQVADDLAVPLTARRIGA